MGLEYIKGFYNIKKSWKGLASFLSFEMMFSFSIKCDSLFRFDFIRKKGAQRFSKNFCYLLRALH